MLQNLIGSPKKCLTMPREPIELSTHTVWPCDTRNSLCSHVLTASFRFHTESHIFGYLIPVGLCQTPALSQYYRFGLTCLVQGARPRYQAERSTSIIGVGAGPVGPVLTGPFPPPKLMIFIISERYSASALFLPCRLTIYLRSTMGQKRLNSVILLHRCILRMQGECNLIFSRIVWHCD